MELRYFCPRMAARFSSRRDCDARREIAEAYNRPNVSMRYRVVTRYISCMNCPGPVDTALAGLSEIVHGGRKAHRAASPERVIG